MTTILLDTNIVLDIALERNPFYEESKKVLSKIISEQKTCCVTSSSVTDIYYITKKITSHERALNFLINLFSYVEILSVDKKIILAALTSGQTDFEDSVQKETARHHHIRTIVTRNKKDYQDADLQVFTPEEFCNPINE